MSLSATFGVFVALGAVLALLVVVLRVLKRFAPHAGGGSGRLPMEIVQRLPVGPRQSIAVVRIGERVLAVAIGGDGMQTLTELEGDDRATVLGASVAPTPFASSPVALRGVASALARHQEMRALPGAGWLLARLGGGATSGAASAPAERQRGADAERRGRAVVPAHVAHQRRPAQPQHARLALAGPAAQVRDEHVGADAVAQPRLAHAAAERDVLVVDEERLVEPAQAQERLAADGHAGPGQPVQLQWLARHGTGPQPAGGQQLVRADRVDQGAADRGLPAAHADLDPAVGQHGGGRHRTESGVGGDLGGEVADLPGRRRAVRVHEHHDVTGGRAGARVGPGREPAARPVQVAGRGEARDDLREPVDAAAVVDHHHRQVGQVCEQALDQRRTAVGDEYDLEVGSGRHRGSLGGPGIYPNG